MNLLFTGDINWGERKFTYDETYKLLEQVQPIVKSADYVFPNLECPLGNREDYAPIKKDGPNLICHEENIAFLKALNATAVTIGNNHIGDFGDEALKNTLKLLDDNNIGHVGAGKNTDEAYGAFYLKKDGLTVAVISVCENEFGISTPNKYGAAGYNPRILLDKIRKEKETADYVIIVFHGGNEHNPLPSPDTKDRYRFICDMGADAVIACHTHCPQGYEMYDRKPIIYSMGNFVFCSLNASKAADDSWYYGYLTMLNVTKSGISVATIPYKFDEALNKLKVFDGNEKKIMADYLEKISELIKDDEMLKQYFKGWAWNHRWGAVLPGDATDAEHYNLLFRYNSRKCEAHMTLARQILEILFYDDVAEAEKWEKEIEKLQKMPI